MSLLFVMLSIIAMGSRTMARCVDSIPMSPAIPFDMRDETGSFPADPSLQLVFIGEGEVVPRYPASASPAAPAAPAGTTNGAGALRFDATDENAGKADFGFDGFALPSSGLLALTAEYRYWTEPVPTSRTPGIGHSVFSPTANCGASGPGSGSNACYYTFSFTDTPGYATSTWNTVSINAATGSVFRLFGPGSPATSQTMAQWQTDPTWGPLFSPPYEIVRANINLGSFQRNALVYVDYLESSVLGPGRIEFQESNSCTFPSE